MAFAAEFTGEKAYGQGKAILRSPLTSTSTDHCLTLDYFVRSSLNIYRLEAHQVNCKIESTVIRIVPTIFSTTTHYGLGTQATFPPQRRLK